MGAMDMVGTPLQGCPGPLMTVRDVANMLQVSEKWVYRVARSGQLPSIRIGRVRRFSRTDIHAWIEKHKQAEASLHCSAIPGHGGLER